jgi:hypothetical protein
MEQVVIALGVALLGVLAYIALSGGTVPQFPDSLESWTGWVASLVAIVVPARVLWSAAAWIEKKVAKM